MTYPTGLALGQRTLQVSCLLCANGEWAMQSAYASELQSLAACYLGREGIAELHRLLSRQGREYVHSSHQKQQPWSTEQVTS